MTFILCSRFIHLFLSILTLKNKSQRSLETSICAELSTETRIQEAMNPQKHRCENLECSKCDTAVRKERKQLAARRRNIRKLVLTLIRGKQSGLKWLRVTEVLTLIIQSPESFVHIFS
jgi:hypothetical protein